MAGSQPATSQKLRDALTDMDQSDLDNHVQRTADWLRSGINPNSNGTEKGIADGLAKLNQQLRAAEGTLGKGGAPGGRRVGPDKDQQTAALSQVERLRGQLEAMQAGARSSGRAPGQLDRGQGNGQQGNGQQGNGRNGQGGQRRYSAGPERPARWRPAGRKNRSASRTKRTGWTTRAGSRTRTRSRERSRTAGTRWPRPGSGWPGAGSASWQSWRRHDTRQRHRRRR